MRSRLDMENMDPSRVCAERMLPDDELLLYSVRPYSVKCSVLCDALCFPLGLFVLIDVAVDLGDTLPDGGSALRKSSRFHSGTSELSKLPDPRICRSNLANSSCPAGNGNGNRCDKASRLTNDASSPSPGRFRFPCGPNFEYCCTNLSKIISSSVLVRGELRLLPCLVGLLVGEGPRELPRAKERSDDSEGEAELCVSTSSTSGVNRTRLYGMVVSAKSCIKHKPRHIYVRM